MTDTITQPETSDLIGQWPPVAHVVRQEDLPVREGTIALCGAKLMGIDLRKDGVEKANCEKCIAIVLADPRVVDDGS